MKRWIGLFLTLTVAVGCLLGGCAADNHADRLPITQDFSCHATITYHDLSLQGDLCCSAADGLQMTFSEPKSLQNITIGWNGNDVSMKLAGMTVALNADSVPQGALLACLLAVLNAAPTDRQTADEGLLLTGTVQDCAYVAVFDPETGLIRSISVPEQSVEAVFTDVKRID